MKQFTQANFTRKEDIQIQVSTARLGFYITLPTDTGSLADITVRARLVSPNFGTQTIIERMTLETLFEIAAHTEGFYRRNVVGANSTQYIGHIDIARNGALNLNNQTYISLDIVNNDAASVIQALDVYSIQHPKMTSTYLHYNPVTITQALQSVPLAAAVDVVLPIAKITEVQLTYPGNTVPYVQDELRLLADMMNDIVSVANDGVSRGSVTFGYENVMVLPVRDALSGADATRLQVESAAGAGQFNIYLIEEKTL